MPIGSKDQSSLVKKLSLQWSQIFVTITELSPARLLPIPLHDAINCIYASLYWAILMHKRGIYESSRIVHFYSFREPLPHPQPIKAFVMAKIECFFPARFFGVAHVAELVDALDSGSSGVKPVEVRVLS